ncbi:hypothetical protein [Alcanivorax sp.]|jgi:hypothetical protein|uniref:hypothetical protein n=1 Tax=Alcanivorax sp. TaxID=1872427 RepID=UPI0032D8B60F
MSKQSDQLRQQLVGGVLRQLHLEAMSERFNPRVVLAPFCYSIFPWRRPRPRAMCCAAI